MDKYETRLWRELQYQFLLGVGFFKIQKLLKLKPVKWLQYRIDRDKLKE